MSRVFKKKDEPIIDDNEEIKSSDSELDEENENHKVNNDNEPDYFEKGIPKFLN
jgi:hypothetical protein